MLLFALFCALCNTHLYAQTTRTTLDFWVGTWDAYQNDSLMGTNVITTTLKNRVVEENFSRNDKTYIGRSWSVFDSAAGVWRQTWVDDTGAYLTLTGGKDGDKVILSKTDSRTGNNGKPMWMRMVFFNITPNSFDWDWQRSDDDKKTWSSVWFIRYKRR